MSTKKSSGTNDRLTVVLNGQELKIREHKRDFSVLAHPASLTAESFEHVEPLGRSMSRVTTHDPRDRDTKMEEVRRRNVAHHIYQVDGTDEEIVIDDHIILNLRHEGTGQLEQIMEEFHLVHERKMGSAHVLRLTQATGINPVKAATRIAQREEVAACSPQVMLDLQLHQTPPLFREQWYLTTDLINHPDVAPGVDIGVLEAWQFGEGDPEIVVAVIDDGFDLGHPAFAPTRIHADAKDFVGQDPSPVPGQGNYHGTPVASIALGSNGPSMRGIAPGCTFLPVRIGFGQSAPPIDILDVFQYVSDRADVVNCSFGTSPRSFDPFPADFRAEITKLTETGGRRGKGLVMVFSAANDDAPTFLAGSDNVNGVKFTKRTLFGTVISEIPAGSAVFSGYPMTPGVITVAALSSLRRKSGYSCWGPHITVTAPSNNGHYIQSFGPTNDPRRKDFLANYRGLGQVAAANRPGHGAPFDPIATIDDPTTPVLIENQYTRAFGGTSGAAPVVTGVVALMLSAHPDLTAQEVHQILVATADRDLDPTLDLLNDPNIQGLSGGFVDGHSLFFGAGKIDAFRAVRRARSLVEGDTPIPEPSALRGEAHPNIAIPDDQPAGVLSSIEITGAGRLSEIRVDVDLTHTWRGDLRVLLIAPGFFVAELHRLEGGNAQDLKAIFTNENNRDLGLLARAGIEVGGRWFLHVSDLQHRDVGRLNAWSLEIRTR